MADLFISYAREDQPRVEALVAAIERRGWSVFWDRQIPAGQTWRGHIGGALTEARCVLVAWSTHSVASRWVIDEAEEGQQRGALLPVLLDAVTPPMGFRGTQAADLSDWQPGQRAPELERLLDDIGVKLEAGPRPAPTRSTPRTPVRRARTFVSRGALGVAAALALLLAIGAVYWVLESRSPKDSPRPAADTAKGRVETKSGAFEFVRISGMYLSQGKLAVQKFGATAEIPLATVAKIDFLGDNRVKVHYVSGKTEDAVFDCYWNTPVTFHLADQEIYYGDCAALRGVQAIAFHH